MSQRLLALVGRRRLVAGALGAILVAAVVGRALLGLGPARLGKVGGCRLRVALAVPVLEAAPLVLVGAVARSGGRACTLSLTRGRAAAQAPLALLPGDAWAAPEPSTRVPFLLVAQRAGALLVARVPVAPHFLWHGVSEHVVLLPDQAGDLGPTVVRAMLSLHEVAHVSVLRGLGRAAYAAGTGDFLELPLWPAEEALGSHAAHFAADLAIQGGPLPAAVLAASPAFARTHSALLDRIAVAVARASVDLMERPRRMARRWPGRLAPTARAALERALLRARYEHLWPSDPRVEATLFARLGVLRRAAGETDVAAPTALAAPAERAMRVLAPPPAG